MSGSCSIAVVAVAFTLGAVSSTELPGSADLAKLPPLYLNSTKGDLSGHCLKGDTSESLEALLRHYKSQGLIGELSVVLGFNQDPFLSFEEQFHLTMRCLKIIARFRPESIVLRTRSPLIVLALPMLKSLGSKLTIVMGLEGVDDGISREFFPTLPLASERIKAVRALKNFELNVRVQVAPCIPVTERGIPVTKRDEQLEEMANILKDLQVFVTVAKLAMLLPRSERGSRERTGAAAGDRRVLSSDKVVHDGLDRELFELLRIQHPRHVSCDRSAKLRLVTGVRAAA